MVLDAQPLEDEAGYGRLIELEGRGTFLKKSIPRPSKDFWACRIPVHVFSVLYGWGEKAGGGKADP